MASSERRCVAEDNMSDDAHHDVQVIVMSDSGKPIFADTTTTTTTDVARICGLVQAVRTSLLYSSSSSKLGDIQSLHTAHTTLVFQTVGSITLVAISRGRGGERASDDEAYLRLQLEYVYAQIIFTMTDQVQAMYSLNPSLDLQSMLMVPSSSSSSTANSSNVLRAIWRQTRQDPAPFWTAAVPSVFPLSPAVRHSASTVLQQVGDQTPNTVFALLLVRHQLVTLVQPSFRPHQLRSADLHLMLDFLHRRQHAMTSDELLWLPLCLPRFHSCGFLTCLTHCLDETTGLVLALVSQDGTTEQFQLFRAAAARIRRRLGIPPRTGSVLRIRSSTEATRLATTDAQGDGNDVPWSRTSSKEGEEQEESASCSNKLDDDEEYEIVPHDVDCASGPSLLVDELAAIQKEDGALVRSRLEEYLDVGVEHFVFRIDVPVLLPEDWNRKNGKKQHGEPGFLTQCISPSLDQSSLKDSDSQRNIWAAYQTLSLRLRLGSANHESVSGAYAAFTAEHSDEASVPSIAKDSPAMCLFESTPRIQGVSFISKANKTYLAMNGQGFELYVKQKRNRPSLYPFIFSLSLLNNYFHYLQVSCCG